MSAQSIGCPAAGRSPVYAAVVSGQQPQTYILHTVALFAVLVTVMVIFLMRQWGGH